jgi:hypothetical protein
MKLVPYPSDWTKSLLSVSTMTCHAYTDATKNAERTSKLDPFSTWCIKCIIWSWVRGWRTLSVATMFVDYSCAPHSDENATQRTHLWLNVAAPATVELRDCCCRSLPLPRAWLHCCRCRRSLPPPHACSCLTTSKPNRRDLLHKLSRIGRTAWGRDRWKGQNSHYKC